MRPPIRHRQNFPKADYVRHNDLCDIIWEHIEQKGKDYTFAVIYDYGNRRISEVFNTHIIGISQVNFTFKAFKNLPYHAFYKLADRVFSYIGLEMASNYPTLTNKIYSFQYPIKYERMGKVRTHMVKRNTCLRHIIGGPAGGYEADIMIFQIMRLYHGEIIASLPVFEDNLNGYKWMVNESNELIYRGAKELRNKLLTSRQAQVFDLIAKSYTEKNIAEILKIKLSSVKDYKTTVTEKVNRKNLFVSHIKPVELAMFFRRMKII